MIWIYFTIILFCLGASLLNKVSRQNFLYAYFILVVFYELGLFKKIIPPEVYNSSPIAYITFFIFYYAYQKNSYRKTVYIFGLTSLAVCFSFFYINGIKNYSIKAGTTLSVIYIFFALQWFLSQLINVDEISLHKKQSFWVSTSLLVWSVFFLFRLIPMHWLNINDKIFLNQLDEAFRINTIISYVIFLRALFCKH